MSQSKPFISYFYNISQQDLEVLNWIYNLNLAIIFVIIILIIILRKNINEKDLWEKTTIVWIITIVFIVLIGVCISAWYIDMIINNIAIYNMEKLYN